MKTYSVLILIILASVAHADAQEYHPYNNGQTYYSLNHNDIQKQDKRTTSAKDVTDQNSSNNGSNQEISNQNKKFITSKGATTREEKNSKQKLEKGEGDKEKESDKKEEKKEEEKPKSPLYLYKQYQFSFRLSIQRYFPNNASSSHSRKF